MDFQDEIEAAKKEITEPRRRPPDGGFLTIKAASGRGYFVIVADEFTRMSKPRQKKLLDYAIK